MIQRIVILGLVMIILTALILVPVSYQVSAETSEAASGNLLMTGPVYMKDVKEHWARPYIDEMKHKTIAFGFLDQTFRPDQPMSRLDVAIMLAKGLGLETWKTAEDSTVNLLPFTDLSSLTAEQKKYVYIISGLGYMIGDQAGTFRPNDAITRDEFATLLVRALGYEHEKNSDTVNEIKLPFADKKEVPDWAYDYVRVAWDHQLMIGYKDNGVETFRPKREITRAEVTTVISRIDAMTISKVDDSVYLGTVAEVDANAGQLTMVSVDGQRYVMSVREDAAIYVNGKAASLAEVMVDMKVKLIMDGEGRLAFLDAGERATEVKDMLHILKGTVVENGWSQLSETVDETTTAILQLKDDSGVTLEVTVNQETVAYLGDEEMELAQIEQGAEVSVTAVKDENGVYVAQEVRVFSEMK